MLPLTEKFKFEVSLKTAVFYKFVPYYEPRNVLNAMVDVESRTL